MLGIEQNPQFGFESKVFLGAENAGSGESVDFSVQNVESEKNLGTGTVG